MMAPTAEFSNSTTNTEMMVPMSRAFCESAAALRYGVVSHVHSVMSKPAQAVCRKEGQRQSNRGHLRGPSTGAI